MIKYYFKSAPNYEQCNGLNSSTCQSQTNMENLRWHICCRNCFQFLCMSNPSMKCVPGLHNFCQSSAKWNVSKTWRFVGNYKHVVYLRSEVLLVDEVRHYTSTFQQNKWFCHSRKIIYFAFVSSPWILKLQEESKPCKHFCACMFNIYCVNIFIRSKKCLSAEQSTSKIWW